MSFSIGDLVVHPAHGPGWVVDLIERNDVSDPENRLRQFYVIHFEDQRLTLHVPVRHASELGLRSVMAPSKYQEVMQLFRATPQPLPDDFKERRTLIEGWIQSGAPLRLARAVRELYGRRSADKLNKADRELLAKAQDRLVAEMAAVKSLSPAQVMDQISAALEEGQHAKAA